MQVDFLRPPPARPPTNAARRIAHAAPQRVAAYLAGLAWLAVDVGWKLYRAPRVQKPAAMVAIHLGVGLVALAATACALGAIARRRHGWRPAWPSAEG